MQALPLSGGAQPPRSQSFKFYYRFGMLFDNFYHQPLLAGKNLAYKLARYLMIDQNSYHKPLLTGR